MDEKVARLLHADRPRYEEAAALSDEEVRSLEWVVRRGSYAEAVRATWLAGMSGRESAVAVLRAAASSSDSDLRLAAAGAAAELHAPSYRSFAHGDASVPSEAAPAAAVHVWSLLFELSHDSDPDVRAVATDAVRPHGEFSEAMPAVSEWIPAVRAAVDETIEVNVPVRTAYDQWTQFESFPQFMEGVEEVRQLTDTRIHWRAEIGGVTREFDAEITEQVPDQRIAWRAVEGAGQGGVVIFHAPDPNRTRILLELDYDPEGVVEEAGDKLGVVKRRVKGDLQRFKEFIENRGIETGAWRGDVR